MIWFVCLFAALFLVLIACLFVFMFVGHSLGCTVRFFALGLVIVCLLVA